MVAPYYDETLESYLLRLSSTYKTPYRYLAASLSIPDELSLVNLYHERNGNIREQQIKKLEIKLKLDSGSLIDISIRNSTQRWGVDYPSYQLRFVRIPSVLYRRNNIPICPHCIKESPYIKVNWHFQTSIICPIHQVQLMFTCPNCHIPLSYIRDELIDRCVCGAYLSNSPVTKQEEMANADKHCESLESVFGALLFYKKIHEFSVQDELGIVKYNSYVDFVENPFDSISNWIEIQFEFKKRMLLKRINEYSFEEFFGGLIIDSQNLPDMSYERNIILLPLKKSLKNFSSRYNLPAFLSVNEASVLLNCDQKIIKKNIGEGKIAPRFKTLKTYVPLIDLREIIELI